MESDTIKGISYASAGNLAQCLFTNGSLLEGETAEAILNSNLTFVRISLKLCGCGVSPEISWPDRRKMVGCSSKKFTGALRKKSQFAIEGENTRSRVLVLDSKNIADFQNTLRYLSALATAWPCTIDYVVIRAVNADFAGVETETDPQFFYLYQEGITGKAIQALEKAGVEIVLPNSVALDFYLVRAALAVRSFQNLLQMGPCFCVLTSMGTEIMRLETCWKIQLRPFGLRSSDTRPCKGKASAINSHHCPHYSRGWYFIFLIAQIEKYRQQGNMETVKYWIASLQKHVPNLHHSFYI